MKKASIAIIIAGGLMSQSAVAIEKMYGVVSAGYTDLEYSNTVEESCVFILSSGAIVSMYAVLVAAEIAHVNLVERFL